MTANIHDRASIERVYPREAYASDASQNELRKPAMLRGVRIAAAPDEKGEFAIEPAVQHAGEVPEIGRASCRERVVVAAHVACFEKEVLFIVEKGRLEKREA